MVMMMDDDVNIESWKLWVTRYSTEYNKTNTTESSKVMHME